MEENKEENRRKRIRDLEEMISREMPCVYGPPPVSHGDSSDADEKGTSEPEDKKSKGVEEKRSELFGKK